MMKNQLQAFLLALGLLLAGVLVYLSEQDQAGFISWLNIHRLIPFSAFQFELPGWVTGSLPDGLWMCALVICILAIWDFSLQGNTWFWIVLAMIVGVGFEVGQGLHWIRGTFDYTDILCLCVGGLIPILLLQIRNACKRMLVLSPR